MKKHFKSVMNLAIKVLAFSTAMVLSPNMIFSQEFQGGDTSPFYTGGNKALKEFISKNLVFPDSLKKAGISGIITVSYVINKEGKVEDVKLVRGIHPVCDSEAVRVTRLLPDWNAAYKMGKTINFNVLMPIEFRNEYNFDNKRPVIVTGTVTDHSTGRPIEGSLIIIKGTNIGTITNANGWYKLDIPGGDYDLEYFSIGYTTKSEHIGKNRTINVKLDSEYYIVD